MRYAQRISLDASRGTEKNRHFQDDDADGKEEEKKLVFLLIKCCSIRKRFGGHLQFVVMFPSFLY